MDLNLKLVVKIGSLILGITAIGMIPSIITAIIYNEIRALISFSCCTLVYGWIGFYIFKNYRESYRSIRLRDGYLTVSFCWIFACLAGAIPYATSGTDITLIQSIFESTAGFTTTGVTVLTEQIVPKSVLMFKAVTHWLGGMGILIFVVSVLPALGIGGQNLARAESPAPRIEKVTDRISDTARIMYTMYLSFTIIEFILLCINPRIDIFDSIVNTLSTISTGGFMTHDSGIMYYDSVYIETVITVFSILVAINFNLYYFLVNRRYKEVLKNTELRVFILMIVFFSLAIAIDLVATGTYDSARTAIRHSLTQVVSFASTSGFTFASYMSWPAFSRMLLFILLLVGGCASSTAGGIKVIRMIIVGKLISRGFSKRIHPISVVAIRVGDDYLDSRRTSQIATFTLLYMTIFVVSCMILSFDCPSIETTIGTVASIMSNTGVMMGDVIVTDGFNTFSPTFQLYISLLMLIGRLELFTILVMFSRSFWNPSRQVTN